MNIEKNAVLLGGNPLNYGIVAKLRALGYFVIVVDFRRHIDLACDLHIVADAKDPDSGEYLKSQNIKSVDLVYTSMDNAGLAQKSVCRAFGLLCADTDALEKAHHKGKMHQAWAESGLLNRVSIRLEEFDKEKLSALNAKYPVIVKPIDSCASRGISILPRMAGEEALEAAFLKALAGSDLKEVNIEEYIEGTEFTVEMLGDNYGNVSIFGISKKYHTENTDNNKIAVKLHYNSPDVSGELQDKLADFGKRCYQALGLKNTMGHLEVIVKKDGSISPIELGARSSGFIASDLVDIVSGQCFLQALGRVQHGEPVLYGLIPQTDYSSMYFFYDIPEGYVSKRRATIMPYLKKGIVSLHHMREQLVPGKQYHKIMSDTERYGFEILKGPKEALTISYVKEGEKEFLAELAGMDGETLDLSIPIFDCITHPTPDNTWLNIRYNHLADLDDLNTDMKTYGVKKAFAVGMKGIGGYELESYAGFVNSVPGLYPIAYWDFEYPPAMMLEIKSKGYAGIKIHPRLSGIAKDSESIFEVIEYANKAGLIVLYCSFEGISEKFTTQCQGKSFIMLHSGWQDFENVAANIPKLGNILFDLSYTLFHRPEIRPRIITLIRQFPDKFCIGSDHPEISLRELRLLINQLSVQMPMEIVARLAYDNLNSYFSTHAMPKPKE